ncbi:hypothetical protein VE04_08340 [Pseudogymnoascus sp. 24MN13]|nr:hypothetical protein VE04_08340 [Pseudogymnoascus sp. 24MN13]
MGGDLNLKKSWHPVLMSNQKKVWEEEKKALDERKKTELRIKELKEERAKEEIQQKLEAAGSRKRVDRVDWMYQGPSNGQSGTTEEMEGYLLGKRRIDTLIKGNDHKKLEKQASEDSFMALQKANTLKDTAAKVREDPMLAIKRQEQAAYEAMMNDPIKRKQLLAVIGGEPEGKEKTKERKHRHHHRRHHDDASDDRRHKRRRVDDSERDGRSNPVRLSVGVLEVERSVIQGTSRLGGGVRDQCHLEEGGIRDHLPREGDGIHDHQHHLQEEKRDETDVLRHLAEYPYLRVGDLILVNDPDQRGTLANNLVGIPTETEIHGPMAMQRDETEIDQERATMPGNPQGPHFESVEEREAERQRKLAAMQEDASALDQDREKRLAALAEKEKIVRDADEAARVKSAKYSDKADFVNGMHQKVGSMGLADRIGRGRQGLQRDD